MFSLTPSEEGLNLVFQDTCIKYKLMKLLYGEEVLLDTSQRMSVTDVLYWVNGKTESKSPCIVNGFFLLLYHFGYLTVNRTSERGFVFVKIPNEEVKYEFGKFLSGANSCSDNYANDIRFTIDSLTPDRTDRNEMFETFGEAIKIWYYSQQSNTDFLTDLFVILVTKPEYSRTAFRALSHSGPMVILLENKHKVTICITGVQAPKYGTVTQTVEKTITTLADSSFEEQIFNDFNKSSSRVLIGISFQNTRQNNSYYNENREVNFIYAYHFREGDNLKDYVTINI